MFTKETSYDRYASISLKRRYGTADLYVDDAGNEADFNNATKIQVALTDASKPFKVCGAVSRDDYTAKDKLREQARAELLTAYPQADDPFAYWD